MARDDLKESVCPWCGAPCKEFWPDREPDSMSGLNWKCGSSRAFGSIQFDGFIQKDRQSDVCRFCCKIKKDLTKGFI